MTATTLPPRARAFGPALLALFLCCAACGCTHLEDERTPASEAHPDALIDPGQGDVRSDTGAAAGAESPACRSGFVADDSGACVDRDECTQGTHDCAPHALCTNTPGGYGCACPAGTVGDGHTCALTVDCRDGAARCAPDATCTATSQGHFCMCNDGFIGDGLDCTDLDECATGRHDCPPGATCSNTPGSFRCGCAGDDCLR